MGTQIIVSIFFEMKTKQINILQVKKKQKKLKQYLVNKRYKALCKVVLQRFSNENICQEKLIDNRHFNVKVCYFGASGTLFLVTLAETNFILEIYLRDVSSPLLSWQHPLFTAITFFFLCEPHRRKFSAITNQKKVCKSVCNLLGQIC